MAGRIEPGSPAFSLGLRDGDVIEAVNSRPVSTIEQFSGLLQNAAAASIIVLRGEAKLRLATRLGS